MKKLDTLEALNQLKKLPFSKSWQNIQYLKKKKILNPETKQLVENALADFIYIPAPSLIRHFGQ